MTSASFCHRIIPKYARPSAWSVSQSTRNLYGRRNLSENKKNKKVRNKNVRLDLGTCDTCRSGDKQRIYHRRDGTGGNNATWKIRKYAWPRPSHQTPVWNRQSVFRSGESGADRAVRFQDAEIRARQRIQEQHHVRIHNAYGRPEHRGCRMDNPVQNR